MVAKSCTTKRMVETLEIMGLTTYQLVQDFATIHDIASMDQFVRENLTQPDFPWLLLPQISGFPADFPNKPVNHRCLMCTQ